MIPAALHSASRHWHASLDLQLQNRAGRTVVTRARHEGPLRVQRAFYPETEIHASTMNCVEPAHVYLLHPPGGIVGGDVLDIRIELATACHALLTTPGSTKVYRSAGDVAQLRQTFHVRPAASLEWFVQESILFPGARLASKTEVHLHGDATFIGWDITCLGRPENHEIYSYGEISSHFSIFRDGLPLVIENLMLSDAMPEALALGLHGPATLRGFAMQASFFATGCGEDELEQVRQQLECLSPVFPVAATLLDDVLVVRALAEQTEAIQAVFIPLWEGLRPRLLQRPAVRPRIWNT